MRLYRDEAVVLRTQKLGEADRIITLLTRHHGQVRASAKGVRRTSSRFGARLEPFMHVDLQLNQGRSLDTVTQAVTLAPHGGTLSGDYPAYVAATAVAETASRLTEDAEPATQQFLLVLGAVRTLAGRTHAPTLVLDAYLLRALSVAGWAISLTSCAGCGSPGPHRAFSVPAGGAVCPQCRPPGAVAPDPATLRLLSALLTGDWATADASEPAHRREGSGLVAAHLQWHLERGVRSLTMVERS